MATLVVTFDSVIIVTETIVTAETFSAEVKIAGLATDISLTLGLLTAPKYLIVVGPIGASFKLAAAGTDSIVCNPVAIASEADLGDALTEILISNSQAQEATVTVYAGE